MNKGKMKPNRLTSILLIFVLSANFLGACGGSPVEEKPTPIPISEKAAPTAADPTPDSTPLHSASVMPAEKTPGQKADWLFMMYQDADDKILEKDTVIDLNEAEMVGSTGQVTILSQMDRGKGGYRGDGNWTSTKRFYVTKDKSADLTQLHSKELMDLGELDMGDPTTLVDFVTWAVKNYPAEHYALILADHGMGWPGGWSDDAPNKDSYMTMQQIDDALGKIVKKTGIGQFDLIGFDACLMAQLEVFSAIAPYARYAVASEETEPSIGWAYSAFLQQLVNNPHMDGKELAKNIVNSYIDQDGRITNEKARLDLIKETYSRSKDMSPKQLAAEFKSDITLTAVDLSALRDLNSAVNNLVISLQKEDPKKIARARSYAQSYTSIFGEDSDPSYIDLGNLTTLLADKVYKSKTVPVLQAVQQTIQAAVIAERHGKDREGSTGFSIFFPNSDIYEQNTDPEWDPYAPTVSRFSKASLWDDFLDNFYKGKKLNPKSADLSVLQPAAGGKSFTIEVAAEAPHPDLKIKRPGAGTVNFQSLKASPQKISPDGKVTLTTTITGENVSYIYIYTAYYDPDSKSYLTMDLDFVDAGEIKEANGVYYPDWGEEGKIEFEMDWEPSVTLISDGTTEAMAASEAEVYGKTAQSTFYRVWGSYKSSDSDEPLEGFLRFDANGDLQNILVFNPQDEGDAAPHEVIPAPGDTFTIEQEWLSFDNNPEGEYEYYDGDTLTFGDEGFTMVYDTAMKGSYQVGLVVEDLEGKTFDRYVEVEVK
jgi:hypothetical protein